jgi:2-polyprenyl-6-methoxyphenol hydroxylase-like FAD-dependent oxidoreductase
VTDSDNRPGAVLEDDNAERVRRDLAVLVVGAGPTGLLLASGLQRRGVPIHLIDARPAPLHWDRATVVHPRSLEVFESLGLVDRFLDAGCRQRTIKIHSGSQVLGTMDLSTCGSIYGFNLGLSEEVTESILTDYLHRHGGEVNRSSRLVGLTHHPDGALADIERDGGRYQVQARWVVGCDGLHSPTRELSGIGLEGHDIAKPWAVFDATLQGWADTFEANFVYLETLPVILTALPGQRWRVYMRPSSPESDLVAEATSITRLYAPAVSFVDVENPTRFHCHTKVATKFRTGAVFLAGDSAHLCSPAEGHGMNSGLQDAFNLAWKLALVHHGATDPALLDSYEAERRPIAEMITQSGDVAEHAQTMTDPAERNNRDQAIKAMLADPKARHHEVVAETELNVDYVRSPIVSGDANTHLASGKRLPNTIQVQRSDGQPCRLDQLAHRAGHTLLLLGGPTADGPALVELQTALQELATDSPLFEAAVALSTQPEPRNRIGRLQPVGADLLGVQGTTLLVVRPDGYIGLRSDGEHLSALERYRKLLHAGGDP